jgi:hypothetical protein
MSSSNAKTIEINFPEVANILYNVDTNGQPKHVYMTATMNYDPDIPNLGSKKKYYMAEELYVFGGYDENSDITLVIKLIPMSKNSDSDNPPKPSQVYMCFPLQNSEDKNNENAQIIQLIRNDVEKPPTSLNLNKLLLSKEPLNFTCIKNTEYDYEKDIYVYICKEQLEVYQLMKAFPKDYKWLTNESQATSNYSKDPFDLSVLYSTNPNYKTTVSANIENMHETFSGMEGFKEGASNKDTVDISGVEIPMKGVYIQCKPAGSSIETVPMTITSPSTIKDVPKQSFIIMFIVVMLMTVIVFFGQKFIYRNLSEEFKKNIGIDTRDNIDKTNPMTMFVMFLIDAVPYGGFGYFDNRKYTDYKNNPEFIKRCISWLFYAFFILSSGLGTAFASRKQKKTGTKYIFLFMFLTLIYVQFLFFILMSRSNLEGWT